MTVVEAIDAHAHEFDAHLHFTDRGLKPYYALDSVRKNHDWDGKPTAEMTMLGENWALCFDYDDQPLLPWSDPEYTLRTTPLFRIYFVAKDQLWEGGRADQSKRVRGGTITLRPRWPEMRKENGETVEGYMDLGIPYIDAQIQASNISPTRYPDLLRSAVAAFGVNASYFSNINETSNVNDLALYVRLLRSESGPLHAADGPIARSHNLLTGDREGYREHKEDHRKLPGYYVSSKITSEKAGDLIRGHRYGKELKHYYPNHPEAFDPDEYGYHPKFEVSYQSSITDETVYWDDLDALLRELDETIINCLEWAGLSIRAGDLYHDDEYFKADSESQRSRKTVECPLPDIEDEQEQTIINLWKNMTDSDTELVGHLLADGGTVSPADAADETGYTYRTIRECIDRLEGFIRHEYGEISIESKALQQKMLKRLQSAEQNFRETIESTTREVADALNGREREAWSAWKREYGATVNDPGDCRKLVRIQYRPADKHELKEILREFSTAHPDDRLAGIHVRVTMQDGSTRRIRDPRGYVRPNQTHVTSEGIQRDARQAEQAGESFDWEAWRAAGSPPADRWERIKDEYTD